MENIKKDSNSRTEKYSEWNEKCNGEYQQQNRLIRRQELWNYPIRGEQMKKNGEKKMKKAYVIYGIPSKEPICELLEFQKKRGRKVI